MNIFKKLFLSKELKATLGILEEIDYEFKHDIFPMVKKYAEDLILQNKEFIINKIQKEGRTPREAAYSFINNASGNLLETGRFHIYRGMLTREGYQLLHIFDKTVEKLFEMGAIEEEYLKSQKEGMRECIEQIG